MPGFSCVNLLNSISVLLSSAIRSSAFDATGPLVLASSGNLPQLVTGLESDLSDAAIAEWVGEGRVVRARPLKDDVWCAELLNN